MNKLFGNTKRKRIISMFLLIALVSEIITPTASFALTEGPSQPEATAFTPINTSEMVDLTSGDFKYNIPLMDVGGYPINIAYDSGVGMDQEASWVGLGWNLNVGAINRNMRGLPDDFNGEAIEKKFNMKDNNTFGVNVGVGVELFGYSKAKKKASGSSSNSGKKLNLGIALTYNNYTGIGMQQSASIAIGSGNPAKSGLNGSLGITSSASEGITISPNLSYSKKQASKDNADQTTTKTIGIGVGINSRTGLKDLSFNASVSKTANTSTRKTENGKDQTYSNGSPSDNNLTHSSGGVINFGASTFIPQAQNNMVNNAVALSFKFGTSIFGFDGDITLGGFFSNQSLMNHSSSLSAYGYMFSHEGQSSDNVLMDFNREKDNSFSRYTKNLPITNQTYDVFSVSGQGIGGTYRPFRSDVGYMFDNRSTVTSDSYSGGVELGATNLLHLGVNVSVVDVNTSTGKWEDNNEAMSYLNATSSTGKKDYEPFYFKEVGEKSVSETSTLYGAYGGDEAYRIKLSGLINHKATKNLEKTSTASISLPSTNTLANRQKRNQVISSLNLKEAKLYGLNKSIYTASGAPMTINANAKDDHIAEITALRTDGSRYVYGLPAYNTKQLEVTFNSSDTQNSAPGGPSSQNGRYDAILGYVAYSGTDRTTGNKNGIDNYFNSVSLPAYAHSYLLTAIVSPDYVDLSGNGPTDDDFGNYTKFEYERVSDYNWRMPFDKDKANFNEAAKSVENDDQGNFLTGTKELWFTKKIETKNYIAIFDLDDRKDAVGAAGEDGGLGAGRTKYIKTISLYSKPEYLANPTLAVPIKVVHFDYDYSLCKGVPNHLNSPSSNNNGKLTLKSIYFTYGMSNKAQFSVYNFTYNQLHQTLGTPNNFNYHPKAYDRWGNYKPLTNANIDYLYNSPLNNSEYPYTEQWNKNDADFNASAWNLTQIDLPSGGTIKINYESDDYAFVQNKPVMQMMKVLNVTQSATYSALASNNIGTLYNTSSSASDLYLHFELTQPLTGSGTTADKIRNQYIKEMNSNEKYMYFRFLVNMTNRGASTPNAGNHFEYVSGYAEIEKSSTNCGLSGGTGPHGLPIAYVKLKEVKLNDKRVSEGFVNPIAKAAMNFGRSHYNNLIWDASFSPPADAIEAVKQLGNGFKDNLIKQLLSFATGPNKKLYNKQYCQEFVAGKSWIRLYNPNGHKFGGGSRVKELTIKDNWNSQSTPLNAPVTPTSGQEDSEYGQTFTYETEFDGKTISSGVASYEPMLGGDENPFRQPVYMGPNKWTILTADERFFMEEPFGETFFPSASISYSKVKVKNKIPAAVATNVKTHGTGYVVHEFYTAKDYPTITAQTSIAPKQYKPPLGSLLKVFARDFISASQGYVIKLNDMHGKQKAQSVYAEGSTTPISKVNYFYKTKGGNYTEYGLRDINADATCTPNELDNSCIIINQDGTIDTKVIGIDFDAVADFRESETVTVMAGLQLNLATFLVSAVPAITPSIWPSFSYEKTRFRSAVFTKVISNYGILETTKAQDMGSIVSTSNLAYDAQTGDVLVTRTKNDFEDDIYSIKYPAFWGQVLMGPAYTNIGLSESGINFTNGIASISSASTYYNVGDEIALGGGDKGWICEVQGGSIKLIDKDGISTTINGSKNIKVLRSGRRNLLNSQMASLTSLVNPLDNNSDGTIDNNLSVSTNKVLNTSAMQYSDQWQTFKGYDNSTVGGCNCTLTQQGTDIYGVINNMVASGMLTSPQELLYDKTGVGSFYHNFTNNLLLPNGPGCFYSTISLNNHYWRYQPGPTSNVAEFEIGPLLGSGGTSTYSNNVINCSQRCFVKAELPSNFSWNSITLTSVNGYSVITNNTNCSAIFQICANYTNIAQPIVNPGNNGGITPLNAIITPTASTICFTISPGGKCYEFIRCITTPPTSLKCGVDIGDRVNPFVYGIRGNWRPKTSWSFLQSRTQTSATGNNNVDIRKDGYITSYYSFYKFSGNGMTQDLLNQSYWTYTSEISKMTPNGVEVENKDALTRYSSALYGYNESLPIAVSSNAQLQEIGYDGFEDYAFSSGVCDKFSKEHHFDFYDHKINLNTTQAHTGKYSMKVNSNTSLSIAKKLVNSINNTPFSQTCNYLLTYNDFIQPFSPITTGTGPKKYVLSYWVKEKTIGNESTSVLDYTNSTIGLSISGGAGSIIPGTLKKSEIIDGWQRFEYFFSITAGASGKINIALTNTNTNNTVVSYFDDVRIHPFNSNIKSFVYNPVTLKYVAELDANNFATFYEYDEEGSLVRVKKETEKGIMTIQETKNHTKK